MEPGQGKQGLRPYHRMALFNVLLTPGLVCPLEVPLDSWRSLVRDLQTGLEEDWRELRVALCRQPKAETVMWLQSIQLLLKGWEPCWGGGNEEEKIITHDTVCKLNLRQGT